MTVLRMPGATNPGHELLQSALAQLDRAAKALNLDPGMHRFLQQPERTLIVALPVTMDDGRLEIPMLVTAFGGITDTAGNTPNVLGSPDRLIDYEAAESARPAADPSQKDGATAPGSDCIIIQLSA